ncbi:MAG: hypothetical protein R2729_22730 [Bryobacteraceae bacterium]
MTGSYEIVAFFVVTALGTKYVVKALMRLSAPRIANVLDLTIGAWLVITAIAAWQGWLAFGTMPPRLFFVLGAAAAFTIWFASFSDFGASAANAPIHWLVGYQAFRVAVEIFLHWGWREGFVPRQLTWESCNLDIVTGVTAIPVAFLAARGTIGKRGLLAWNIVGLALLVNVVTVAILSMPTPFRVFPEDQVNRFVTRPPYVWLPAFLVPTALCGHLLVFRRLRTSPA